MTYYLGIDIGTTYTAAAVWRAGRFDIASLGNRAPTIPSVVLLRDDQAVLTGEAAVRRAATEPGRVAREFKRRIGDPTPIIVGGTPYSADALVAKLLRSVVDQVSEVEGGPAAGIAVSHPANWGSYKLDLLRQAISLADLDDVATVTEPEAAAIHYASLERVEPGSIIAVYDLGGGTFDAAVLRKSVGGWEILGSPEGIERLGGVDFDAAVFHHVSRAIGGAIDDLDPDDPTAQAAVARLRQECVDAKEALSSDSDVSIPVLLPNMQTEVRLTRSEYEQMVRPALADTITAMNRALRSAEVKPDDVTTVLLVGGSSRTPLVAELVSSALGRPVAVDAHPKYGVALGAAITAAHKALGDSATGASAPGASGAPAGGGAGIAGVAGMAAAAGAAAGAAGGLARGPAGTRSPDPFPTGPRSLGDRVGEAQPVASAAPGVPTSPGTAADPPPPTAGWGQAAPAPSDPGATTAHAGPGATTARAGPGATTARSDPGATAAHAGPGATTAHAGPAATGAGTATGHADPTATGPRRAALGAYGASAADQRTGRLDPPPERRTGTSAGPAGGEHLAHGGGIPPGGDGSGGRGDGSDGPSRRPLALVAGGVVVAALLAGGAYLGLSGGGGGDDETTTDDAGGEVDETTETAPETTAPPEPTTTTTPLPPQYVQINEVVLEGGRYRVNYEVLGYTPEIGDPGTLHVHFFPDTQPAATAGTNGTEGVDDWNVTDEASTFHTDYTPDNTPGATQMCAAVADHAHAVYTPEVRTGNCVDLPA
jgi:actin-like ATPase involved in cell morphogenesis